MQFPTFYPPIDDDMASATFLEIKDWRTHQHYGKRRPPWIKLYTRLLDDPSFMALPEAAQAQLVKLWVLAAAMGHPLPDDVKFLAGKIGVRGRFYLDVLLASGLLARIAEDASNVLAKLEGNARPLSTENREQRTETTPPSAREGTGVWQPIREHRVAERLATDAGRQALAALLHVAQGESGKAAICAELTLMLDGEAGPVRPTPEQMDVALRDYVSNGMSRGQWNAKHFRGCVRSAVQSPAPASQGDLPRNTAKALAAVNRIAGVQP